MKLKVAIPILLTSASVMVSGLASYALSTAQAQPPIVLPPPTPPGGDGGDGTSKITPFRTGLEETDTTTTPPGARVSFNLEDADLPDLVRIVARITGKRFILPSKARSIKATVYSPTDVTAAEAYQAFLSILDLNGLTLEPSGRYYKIVETTASESHVLPMYEDGQTMPADDRYVTRMHRLEHVAAEDVATLLGHFKSAEGAITAYAPTNTLIITDTAANVRRMLAIVSEVDIARTGEQIWIEPVHYAVATDLVEVLTEMFPPEDASGGEGATKGTPRPPRPGKAPVTREGDASATDASSGAVGSSAGGEARVSNILADERTNSLIIIATERAYLQILEAVRILDVPVDDEGSVHVYELQYADAENMADVLSSLVGGGGGGGASATKSADGSGGAGSITGGDVGIQAYKETNSLIITASQSDYAALRRVLEELDIPPRQVFIEAVIMELQVQRTGRLGFNFHGGLQDPSFPEGQGFSVLGFGASTSLGIGTPAMLAGDTLTGLALGVRGPTVTPVPGLSIPSFGAILTAIATSSDVDVLATPHLLAMDNIEAEITVGSNIPLQQNGIGGLGGLGGLGALGALGGLAGGLGGATGAQGALGALGGLAGGLGGAGALGGAAGGLGGAGGRQNVGTTIRITPHINDAGEIRLEIEEEISEAGAPQGSLGVVPIQQRVAKTQVLVRDQQTVVIGGLMRDRVATTEDKIPILGDIPIIGALFRRESRTTEKTNLLLFLTPYIIRSAEDLRSIFERKMRERQEFLDRYFVFGDHEYEPVLDFSRTRGLVLEIFNELNAIDEERDMAEALAEQPPPDHHARAPLGEADPYDPAEGDLVISPDGEERIHGTVVDDTAPQQ